ncbi:MULTISPECIES: LysR family transcriptional regulator [Shewanella]|uniref:LysR family transcriptional regulator n=1 Tax=Shewanella TaxID=22 RepID=UPI00049199C9|nr:MULTISPECIES: LysR family transcriptional regulator [Shewanella]
MAVSLEQLHAFVAVVEQGGVAQAARSIGKHVSTLREQINTLEIDTGLTLFTRLPRSLQVTEQGLQLYTYAQAMLKESSLFDAKVDSLLQGVPDKLTIAIDMSLVEPALDELLAELLLAFPFLSLKVLNGDTLQVKGWVLSGKADIGLLFSTLSTGADLMTSNGYSFEVVRVIPVSWQIESQHLPRALLDKLQLSLTFLEDVGMRDSDIISHRVLQCNNAPQLLNLIKAGTGWGHLPRFVCQSAADAGEVKYLMATNEVFARWNSDLIWQSNRIINPAMQFVIDGVQALPAK